MYIINKNVTLVTFEYAIFFSTTNRTSNTIDKNLNNLYTKATAFQDWAILNCKLTKIRTYFKRCEKLLLEKITD